MQVIASKPEGNLPPAEAEESLHYKTEQKN